MKLFIHPLFVLFLVFAFVGGEGAVAVALVLAVLVHEFGHALAAAHYGIRTGRVSLLPFGAQVEIDATFLPTQQRVIILLAGSFANMIFALAIGAMLWIFPALFFAWEVLIIANAIPAVINLLPIYPFDGGKILMEFARTKRWKFIVRALSSAVFVGLLVYGLVILHLMTVLMAVMVLAMIHIEFKSTKFVSTFRASKVGEVREVAISASSTLLSVYKHLSPKHYTKFVITDKDNQFLYENELEQLLLKNELSCCIGEAINKSDIDFQFSREKLP